MSAKTRPCAMSRREFGRVAAGAAVPLLTRERQSTAQQSDYVPPPRPLLADAPPFAGALEFTSRHVAPKVEPFPMSQVRLLPSGVFHDALQWNGGYMARLAADRYLLVTGTAQATRDADWIRRHQPEGDHS